MLYSQVIDIAKKGQQVREPFSLAVSVLAGARRQRQNDPCLLSIVLGRYSDFVRNGTSGNLKMPIAGMNTRSVCNQVDALEAKTKTADRPRSVLAAVRLE